MFNKKLEEKIKELMSEISDIESRLTNLEEQFLAFQEIVYRLILVLKLEKDQRDYILSGETPESKTEKLIEESLED